MGNAKKHNRAKRADDAVFARVAMERPADVGAFLRAAGFEVGDDGYAYSTTLKRVRVMHKTEGLVERTIALRTRMRMATAMRKAQQMHARKAG